MKKADATLEDAFIKLIETAKDEEGGKDQCQQYLKKNLKVTFYLQQDMQ